MALISKTGAALKALTVDGVELIDPNAAYNPGQIYFGSILAPWPNRLEDGRYQLAGKEFFAGKLDASNNANHGLVYDREFEEVSASDTEVVLSYEFGADPGYPYSVELAISYELTAGGLRVGATATNRGEIAAPFAIGFHPYFLASEPFELSGAFTHVIQTDSRMLPIAKAPVDGLSYAGGEIDTCYLGASEVSFKTARFELSIELEKNLDHFMFYRPGPDQGESMIAIEPMSSPANAFQNEIAEHLLEPGETREFSFAIRMR
jgi:aldose 1-epimerase